MTQTEFEQKDMQIREAFRKAVIEHKPEEASALIRQHRELCKSQNV